MTKNNKHQSLGSIHRQIQSSISVRSAMNGKRSRCEFICNSERFTVKNWNEIRLLEKEGPQVVINDYDSPEHYEQVMNELEAMSREYGMDSSEEFMSCDSATPANGTFDEESELYCVTSNGNASIDYAFDSESRYGGILYAKALEAFEGHHNFSITENRTMGQSQQYFYIKGNAGLQPIAEILKAVPSKTSFSITGNRQEDLKAAKRAFKATATLAG
jgi:hypothetical protein